MIGSYKKYSDYIPFLLIGLLLIADEEMDNHAIELSCQMIINIIIYVSFFIMLLYLKSKIICLLICVILWLILIFIKKKFI